MERGPIERERWKTQEREEMSKAVPLQSWGEEGQEGVKQRWVDQAWTGRASLQRGYRHRRSYMGEEGGGDPREGTLASHGFLNG